MASSRKPKASAKVAVITGGNRGIGLAIAEEFAAAGWSVAMIDLELKSFTLQIRPRGFVALPNCSWAGRLSRSKPWSLVLSDGLQKSGWTRPRSNA